LSDTTLQKEEEFHDQWASQVDIDTILVDELPHICTLPEIRYIIQQLGDIHGKEILELGCGFGEVSVYFAKQGANATASDLSSGMLSIASRLAERHGVSINTCKCPADAAPFPDSSFDIIYCGNLLHHVDIPQTMAEVARLLKPGGIFASWDPIAYNPAINIYRKLASNVRTDDEHPLKSKDIKTMKKFFSNNIFKPFWFFTMIIFLKFYFIDRINPNEERYWKKIVVEHKKLAPLYTKLENLDRFFLKIFPFLKWLCWNGVFWGVK
jgi:ubiquinone/menaquinone biosynthesis C-methylase UbiE